jgi:hypothetical protein
VKIIACKSWKRGDKGPLGQFQDATPHEMIIWSSTLTKKYPKWSEDCYTAPHKPRLFFKSRSLSCARYEKQD